LQVQASQSSLHISYSYRNAKKANPKNEICLSDIQKHKVSQIMESFALYQQSKVGAKKAKLSLTLPV
jgi:hypothetical protein